MTVSWFNEHFLRQFYETQNKVNMAIGATTAASATARDILYESTNEENLLRPIDTTIKDQINALTGNDDYQFGDLSKYVDLKIKRQVNNLRIGTDMNLALDIFEAVVSSALAVELDRRLKKLILGDENYVLGDATKKAIVDAVKSSTGKDSYSFGDLTKILEELKNGREKLEQYMSTVENEGDKSGRSRNDKPL
ncbi:hypothetical protein HJC23_008028 [Cyclotella cryptica]|uniref:Uncharacterized protein n=1 Tax=Cyclotella cryptica TaxID=29204 RepID=A0ABD3Q3K3_9STRA